MDKGAVAHSADLRNPRRDFSRKSHSGGRSLLGPARLETGDTKKEASESHERVGGNSKATVQSRTGDVRRRDNEGSRPRVGPWAWQTPKVNQGAQLHRRDWAQDDGVVRQDRGRGAPECVHVCSISEGIAEARRPRRKEGSKE